MFVFPFLRLAMPMFEGDAGGAAPPAPAPAAPPPAPVPTGPDGEPFDPERAMATINKLREEVKTLKPAATQAQNLQAQFDALKKAMGVNDANDPDALNKALEDSRKATEDATAKYRKQSIELALTRAAYELGGNALLKDYLKGSGALDDLDIESESYQKDLTDRVKKILEKHPQLKANGQEPKPPIGGVPIPGGSGGDQSLITREMLTQMKPEEIVAAREAGKLTHLGAGPGK